MNLTPAQLEIRNAMLQDWMDKLDVKCPHCGRSGGGYEKVAAIMDDDDFRKSYNALAAALTNPKEMKS